MASSCAGTLLSRVHWLSHRLTRSLLRQVQQQRWQPLAKRRSTSTSVLSVTSVPIAAQTLGIFNASARHLVDDLGRISAAMDETRKTSFLYQRIWILVQCFSAPRHFAGYRLMIAAQTNDCTQFGYFLPNFLNSLGIIRTKGQHNNNNKLLINIYIEHCCMWCDAGRSLKARSTTVQLTGSHSGSCFMK